MNVSSEHVTVRKLAFHSNASSSSPYKFLKSHLKLFPYKVTTGQVLTQSHIDKRLNFCQWFLSKVEDDNSFLDSILWTDECSFTLNRQNIRFLDLEGPTDIMEIK